MHINCSTCLDLLTPSDELTSVPCGHVFHSNCILQWLETGKANCPQCRTKCRENQLRRIYFTEGLDVTNDTDSATLQNRLDSLTFQLRCADTEKKKLKEQVDELTAKHIGVLEEYKVLDKKFKSGRDEHANLKHQVRLLQGEKERAKQHRARADELEEKLKTYETIHVAINGTRQQLMARLHDLNDYSPNAQQLVQVSEQLKRELSTKGDEAKVLHKSLQRKTNEIGELKSKLEDHSAKVIKLTNLNEKLKEDLNHVESERDALKVKLAKLEEAITSPSGDPKSSAISRLIREYPAPLSMNLSIDSPKVPINSVKTCGLIGLKEPNTLKRSASAQENCEPVRGSLFGSKKPKVSSQPAPPPPLRSDSNLFYNGFGGHSKSEDFPTSQPHLKLAKKPKGISRPKVVKPDKKLQTINKYFNFETP